MATETWETIGSIVENIKKEIKNIRDKLGEPEETTACLDNMEKECEALSSKVSENRRKSSTPKETEKRREAPLNVSFDPYPPSFIPEWNKLMNARERAFWSKTRNEGLANLYSQWNEFTPQRVPRKFKKAYMYDGEHEENKIYQAQAVQQMMAEAEVLIIRSSRNTEEIRKIDHQISEALNKV